MQWWITVVVFSGGLIALSSTFAADRAPTPVLVQLFTSEGCSSCPPADALLEEFTKHSPIKEATIIPMSLHVDYWDRLGWRDPFSSGQSTAYQQRYQRALHNPSLYTPQMIVDGRTDLVGSDRAAAIDAITASAQSAKVAVAIQLMPSAAADEMSVIVRVPRAGDLPKDESCFVMLAITEDDLTSQVRRGENAGRKLHHGSVVRYLASIGEITAAGAPPVEHKLTIHPAWNREHLHIVAFVQSKQNLRVYGVATSPTGSDQH